MSERLAEQVRGLKAKQTHDLDFNIVSECGFKDCKEQVLKLITNSPELAELRRDAARYRWLRDPSTPPADECMRLNSDGTPRLLFGNELDAAIDAARGEGT